MFATSAYCESGSFEISIDDLEMIPMETYDLKEGASLNAFSTEAATRSSGSWYDEEIGPNLIYKGMWYSVQLSPTVSIPFGAEITLVSWVWNINGYNPGLIVILGNSISGYYNVTSYQMGATTVFNDINASTPFTFIKFI